LSQVIFSLLVAPFLSLLLSFFEDCKSKKLKIRKKKGPASPKAQGRLMCFCPIFRQKQLLHSLFRGLVTLLLRKRHLLKCFFMFCIFYIKKGPFVFQKGPCMFSRQKRGLNMLISEPKRRRTAPTKNAPKKHKHCKKRVQ
jgi:hypothetical protein